ncbi:maltose/moltooligosaccharide transporter [Pedobacter steynii]|jgi:maltose/moltooligosaccharide transporter|uniref:Maltose/moltooligosaccharide transporter n=1 Tax=Pedobacter steynii TaxID=430522 RepID=A0A1H0H9N4_9SPHI|nr:MFS transporter [Pedobacter steynii]NQX42683.1 MFS transporter [Pedobacter steynii]SDO15855.1 maltose/moltooligosaccharide transporter [Pedobacter steynii]
MEKKIAVSKPRLSSLQIFNLSAGFFGIQFGFALQNGNASRILQTYGADVEHLSLFWLAAPLTGMIVQPIIGYYSDRTWNRFGRRRPYFLIGAVLTALALILMPNSAAMASLLPPIIIGAGMLMIMDASINVAMEPFRALVADKLPEEQRSFGFSMQTFLIGAGAIAGSWLPYILSEYVGVSKVAAQGQIPNNVIYSFYVGAAVLVLTILWTVVTTKEYPPEEMERYHGESSEGENKGIMSIFTDFSKMPLTMKQLGLVQFFSWFALFSMWVFTTPAIAQHIYKVAPGDTSSVKFADAGNWVGILFGIYNGVSAIYALLLPSIAKVTSKKIAHAFSLTAGGIGLLSVYFISNPQYLIFSMIGIGLAWGSILSMPYAILSSSIPARKMGVYMGIFNFFITMPQIVNGFFGGMIVEKFYDGKAIYAIVMAGVFMLLGAISVLYIRNKKEL